MKNKTLYTVIAIIIILANLNQLYWLSTIVLKEGFQYEYNIPLFITNMHAYIALIGTGIFLGSRFRRSSLLRIYMCYCIINLPIWSFIYYTFLSHFPEPVHFSVSSIADIIITVVLFATCCVGLWKLTNDRVLKLTYLSYENGSQSTQFSPATKGKRLANKVVDVVVILFILFTNLYDSYYFKSTDLYEYTRSGNGLLLIEIGLAFIFYLVLEGIFKTTPGKCATNTIIIDEEAQKPSFGKIAGRTLARFIPLEAFSFLGLAGRGWHDTISETYVAESVYILNEATTRKATENENELIHLHKPYTTNQQ